MPIIVHLTPEKNVKRIVRAGILKGKYGVYCMPVLQNYYVSHQWLHELRRWGRQSTFFGIYFRVPDEEVVSFGHFGGNHQQMSVVEALRMMTQQQDPLGYEIVIPRTIKSGEIQKIRRVPQVVGWRYSPDVRKRVWCDCPVCIPSGTFNATKKRSPSEALSLTYNEIIRELHVLHGKAMQNQECEETDMEAAGLLYQLAYRKAGQASDLTFLLDYPSVDVLEALEEAFTVYKGKETKQLRQQLDEKKQYLISKHTD